jgi:hypothetical protein
MALPNPRTTGQAQWHALISPSSSPPGSTAAFVHLAESHGYVITHPSDPEPEVSAGKRIAALICPACGEAIARMPLDDNDQLTPNLEALQSMVQIGGHPCLSNPR